MLLLFIVARRRQVCAIHCPQQFRYRLQIGVSMWPRSAFSVLQLGYDMSPRKMENRTQNGRPEHWIISTLTAVFCSPSFFIRPPQLHTTPPQAPPPDLRIDEYGPNQKIYSAPPMTAILYIHHRTVSYARRERPVSLDQYLQYPLIRIALVQQPRGLDLRPPAPRAAEIAHVRRLLYHLVLDRECRDPYEQRERVPRQETDGVTGVRR